LHWKPSKVFYGWWIVSGCLILGLFSGVYHYGFTAMFEPIADELGWSYTQISFGVSLSAVESGILGPVAGILADRWGPRRLIFGGVIISTVGLLLLSRATSLAMFYGGFAVMGIGSSFTIFPVQLTAVANWFRRKIGIANGIAVSGIGFGGFLVPVVVGLIDMYDWRMTLVILALGMLVLRLPASLLFRHKPEQYGYLPDGQAEVPVTVDKQPSRSQAVEVDVKTKQAIKSSTFWLIGLGFIYTFIVTNAIAYHVMPYLSSIGIARSASSLVATAIPVISIGGRFGLGWLGDKLDKRLVTAGTFAMLGLGTLCFAYVSSAGTWLLVLFLILYGIGYGGSITLRPSLVREYFGRSKFGTLFGLTTGIAWIGNMTGPVLAGWAYDNWGTYQGIWFIFAGLSIPALIAILAIRPIRTAVKLADKASP